MIVLLSVFVLYAVQLHYTLAQKEEKISHYKTQLQTKSDTIEKYSQKLSELEVKVSELEGEIDYHESINGDTGGVYVTKFGKKYHKENCSSVSERFMISYNDAIDAGYEACARCH